ncbi:MAG: hypothetical protein ACKO85_01435 [Isosphaeraceae bacterium]
MIETPFAQASGPLRRMMDRNAGPSELDMATIVSESLNCFINQRCPA